MGLGGGTRAPSDSDQQVIGALGVVTSRGDSKGATADLRGTHRTSGDHVNSQGSPSDPNLDSLKSVRRFVRLVELQTTQKWLRGTSLTFVLLSPCLCSPAGACAVVEALDSCPCLSRLLYIADNTRRRTLRPLATYLRAGLSAGCITGLLWACLMLFHPLRRSTAQPLASESRSRPAPFTLSHTSDHHESRFERGAARGRHGR
jgi:hypothetical protein